MSPTLVSTGTQTIESSFHQPKSGYFIHPDSCSEDESDDDDGSTYDEIYEPCDSEITDEEDETAIENKYVLVEWNQLKMLFTRCLSCGRKAVLKDVSRKGSMFKVCVQCNIHKCEWTSQTSNKNIAEGNMAICAGILLSGLTYNVFRRAIDIMGMMGASVSFTKFRRVTYFRLSTMCMKYKRRVL